jgi:hypothetical protein
MTQSEFTMQARPMSQCDLIAAALEDAATYNYVNDGWVSMPDLVRCSGSYNVHSRISDLRKRGLNIEQKLEVLGDGTRASYYRIV